MEFPVSWVFDRFQAWVFEKSLSFEKIFEFFAQKGQFLSKIWVFDVNLAKTFRFLEFTGQKSLSFWEIFRVWVFRPWVFGRTPKKTLTYACIAFHNPNFFICILNDKSYLCLFTSLLQVMGDFSNHWCAWKALKISNDGVERWCVFCVFVFHSLCCISIFNYKLWSSYG